MDKKSLLVEILKGSGPLAGTFLKERALKRLGLNDEDYPKSTFLKHLQDLVNEKTIKYREEEGKRIYYLESSDAEIQGGLLISKHNGRISVPKILQIFDVRIDEWVRTKKVEGDFNILLQFNSIVLTLNINKDAVPFKIHVSRKHYIEDISSKIREELGERTIVLELPVTKMSSFKGQAQSGQLIISFLENNLVEVTNLSHTNPTQKLDNSYSYDDIFNLLRPIMNQTIHTSWLSESTLNIVELDHASKEKLPAAFVAGSKDCSLIIF